MKGYSYFTTTVKEIFNQKVEKTAAACKQKCMDELACTQLVAFPDIANKYELSDPDNSDASQKLLLSLVTMLFSEIRSIVTNNILLKCHHFFLVSMPRDLSGEILSDISSFDDKLMEEMFDLTKVKQDLKTEEAKETLNMKNYQEKEFSLRDLATQFSRFKY